MLGEYLKAKNLPTDEEIMLFNSSSLKHFRGELRTPEDFNNYKLALKLRRKKNIPQPFDLFYKKGFDCEGQVKDLVLGLKNRYGFTSHIVHKLVVLEGMSEEWKIGVQGGVITGPGVVIGDAIGFNPLTEIVRVRYMGDFARYTEVNLPSWEYVKWRGYDELRRAIA